ncbi:MAG TPA: hypothetical protein DCF44_03000 [Chitinophagaceae bacterium]|nr:hypothetical protein [Chitinophagaceae bacterium]
MKKFLFMSCLMASLMQVSAQKSLRKTEPQFGKNIIAFAPVQLMSNNHVGVGLSYERIMTPYIGLRLPVMFGINSEYINVGIEAKLYPTRNNGAVKYAIAPMLMFGTGKRTRTEYLYNPALGYSELITIETPRTHVGFLLNQSFNFTIMKNFYIGIDGGLGMNYYDSEVTNNSGSNAKISVAAQLHFSLGYRF